MRTLLATVLAVLTACGGTAIESRPGPPPIVEGATTVVANPGPPTTVEPGPGDRQLVLTYTEVGGCAMMGPNCATYRLWSDGTVEVFRTLTGEIEELPEDTGLIDPSLPAKIQRLAGELRFDFLETLPEGSCMACVDGIDVGLEIHLNPDEVFTISSLTHAIPWDEPLFATIAVVRQQMGEQLELELVSR